MRFAGRRSHAAAFIIIAACLASVGSAQWPVKAPVAPRNKARSSQTTLVYRNSPDASIGGESVRYIVLLRSHPVGEALVAAKSLSLNEAAVSELVNGHAARVQAEQASFLTKVKTRKLASAIHDQFTFLINGVALSASREARLAIEQMPEVEGVYPDQIMHATLAESVPLIGAPTAWNLTDPSGNALRGKGMRVAIVDTGVNYRQPDLGGCLGAGCKVVGGYDFVNRDSDPMDDEGHGTHVAGIVAANGTLRGVAPEASLLAYKVLNASGIGSTSDIVAGIERAANPDQNATTADRADVINMSLGGSGTPQDPLSRAVNAAVQQGSVVVVAAGNEGLDYETVSSPGCADGALTVGATSKTDQPMSFSSTGPVRGYLLKPDVVAPGGDINSLALFTGQTVASGTSMAAPHVAGAAALVRQLNPGWSASMVKAALMNTALPLGNNPYVEGTGRIRVDKAVAPGVLLEPGSLSLGIVDNSAATWTASGTIRLTNPTSARKTYQLGIDPVGHPQTGITVDLSGMQASLNPGENTSVTLTVTVNTGTAPMPASFPYLYYGNVVASDGANQALLKYGFRRTPAIPTDEAQALREFFMGMAGPRWYDNTNWMTQSGNEGSWYGVRVEDGHVTRIALPSNYLYGNIPPAIGRLAYLQKLDLGSNLLTGPLPPFIGNLSGLKRLDLWGNFLTGPIPSEYGRLTNLTYLDLSYNLIGGIIPSEMGNLPALQRMYLDMNRLRGSIPASLGSLPNLEILALPYNLLSSGIPPQLGNMRNLKYLGLHANQLAGGIPADLGRLGLLQVLLLRKNSLSGSIPPQLADLRELTTLDLSFNQLYGAIPPQFGQMPKLSGLSLYHNLLSGQIPAELGNLTPLQILYLDGNRLDGAIPTSLANLANLLTGALNLRYNALYTTDSGLRTFLSRKQSGTDWESSQALPPTSLTAGPAGSTAINLTWGAVGSSALADARRIEESAAAKADWRSDAAQDKEAMTDADTDYQPAVVKLASNRAVDRNLIQALADDHGGDCAAATPFPPNSYLRGSIETGGDVDFFRITVTTPGLLSVYSTGEMDMRGYLYDSGCTQISSNDDISTYNRNFRMVRWVTAGTYHLSVRSYSSTDAGDYAVHAYLMADAQGNNCADAMDIGSNRSFLSTLEYAGDYDFYRITVTQPGPYFFYTLSGMDLFGRLYDSSCTEIANDDDSGPDMNFLIQRSLTPGTYYLRVSALGSAIGDYAFMVESSESTAADDFANSCSAVPTIQPNSVQAGGIDYAYDSDYFQFTLSARTWVTLYTEGNIDTVGILRNSSCGSITSNDDGGIPATSAGANFWIRTQLDPGTYYIQVYGFSTSTGSYILHLDTSPPAAFEVYMSTQANGPGALYRATSDLSARSMAVTGLTARTTYYFRVRTIRSSSIYNPTPMTSAFTRPVNATTSGGPPTITATPNRCLVPSGGTRCSVTINTTNPDRRSMQIWALAPGETEKGISGIFTSEEFSQPFEWVPLGTVTFNLYEILSSTAKTRVAQTTATGQSPISVTPGSCTIPTGGTRCTVTVNVLNPGKLTLQIWALAPGETEKGISGIFASETFSQPFEWVPAGTVRFNLYQMPERNLIGTANGVGIRAGGNAESLTASPTTCSIPAGGNSCTVTLTAINPLNKTVQIWARAPGEVEKGITGLFTADTFSMPFQWIPEGTVTFYLYQISGTARTQLATTTASGRR